MMDRKRVYAGRWTVAAASLAILLSALMFTGCGSCQKQAPPAPPPAVKAPAPEAGKTAPEKAGMPAAPAASTVPVTLPVLRLTPESAMVTLAVPPIAGLVEKAVALAKRVAPTDFNVDEELAKAIADMAQDAGTPDAKSIGAIAKAKGLNADAPLAVYVDLTQSAADAKQKLASLKADMEEQAAAAKDEAAKTPDANAPKPPEKSAPKGPDLEELVKSLKPPAIAAVVGCADPVAAENTVKEIVSAAGGYVDPEKVENVDVGGVAVHCYDPEKLAYAITGDKLVASNSLALLKQVLARVNAPAAVRYGTTECAPSEPDEIVLLTRGDKIAALIKELVPSLLAVQASDVKLGDVKLDAINKSLDAFAGDDPIVSTLSWTEQKLELLSRADFAKHPGLAEMAGEAKPLRLATLLPDTTLLMLSLRFNDAIKQNFKTGWLNTLTTEAQQNAGIAQALTNINQVVEIIGDELTVGIAGATGGLPQVFLIAGLGDPAKSKDMISMLAPLTPQEQYAGVDVSQLSIPAPIPVYIVFPADTVMVSNDLEKLKGIIDLVQAKSTSKLFAQLDPALDASSPRYGALLLKTSLLTDVVIPLAGLAGGIPQDIQMPLNKVVEVLREIRADKGLRNNWLESRLTLYLK